MTTQPRISVVTVAFNAADTLEQTMLSVLQQGYDNIEYIVVDGGSNDGTQGIIQRYSDRLKWWVSEPDGGQYDAIEKGFKQATGDIFYWINSDDLMLSHTLEVVVEIFSSIPDLQWLSTLNPIVLDETGAMARVNPIPGFHREAFMRGRYLPGGNFFWGFIQQESTFFTGELWRKSHHVMKDYPLAGDFALWCEMYRHAELVGCAYPLCSFRARAGQRSIDTDRYVEEAKRALEKNRGDIEWSGEGLRERLSVRSGKEKYIRKYNPLKETSVKIVDNLELRDIKRKWEVLEKTVFL